MKIYEILKQCCALHMKKKGAEPKTIYLGIYEYTKFEAEVENEFGSDLFSNKSPQLRPKIGDIELVLVDQENHISVE